MPILVHREGLRTSDGDLRKLKQAVMRSNLGVPTSLPLERAAKLCLALLGDGGRVDLDAPGTVRRATVIIRNAGQ